MAKKLVRFDWAMKKMLRHKANFDILEGFLSELLGEEVKIVQVLDSESNKETEDDCKTAKNTITSIGCCTVRQKSSPNTSKKGSPTPK